MCSELYKNSIIAQEVNKISDLDYGKEFCYKPIVDMETYSLVKSNLGMDIRSKCKKNEKFESVFAGLDFDPDRIRSQAFSVYCNGIPILVSTICIVPKVWIEEQRYIYNDDGRIKVCNIQLITNKEIPNFLIVPAWTRLNKFYTQRFAIKGVRILIAIINFLSYSAPIGTSIEIVAQGLIGKEKQQAISELIEKVGTGNYISEEDLFFSRDIIGKNYPGSTATVKAAVALGLKKIVDTGAGTTLGPVFIKSVK
jgi:hypothetical protein